MQNYVQLEDHDEDDGNDDDDDGIQHLVHDIEHIQSQVSGGRWLTGSHDDCLDVFFCWP